jgi:hypothetical protein
MESKVEFLKEFSITPNYHVVKRAYPLIVSRAQTAEDDGVYDVVGISEQTSSQSATAYNLYITLLKEYVEVFKPEILQIGSCRFTARNFYTELLYVIEDAGAYFVEEHANTYEQVKKLFTIQSLFTRGVFDYFESLCETDRLALLKKVFVETSQLNVTAYFRFRNIEHQVLVDGVRKPVAEYFGGILSGTQDASYLSSLLKEDKIVQAYIEARLPKEDKIIIHQRLSDLINKHQKMVSKLN